MVNVAEQEKVTGRGFGGKRKEPNEGTGSDGE